MNFSDVDKEVVKSDDEGLSQSKDGVRNVECKRNGNYTNAIVGTGVVVGFCILMFVIVSASKIDVRTYNETTSSVAEVEGDDVETGEHNESEDDGYEQVYESSETTLSDYEKVVAAIGEPIFYGTLYELQETLMSLCTPDNSYLLSDLMIKINLSEKYLSENGYSDYIYAIFGDGNAGYFTRAGEYVCDDITGLCIDVLYYIRL